MWTLTSPAFLVTFAVIQTFVFLLLIRLLDLYQHEPLSSLSLMALWGAVGATALSVAGNSFVQGMLPPDVNRVFGVALSAPAVEELAKGVALVAAFGAAEILHRRFSTARLSGVTDGIVFGAAVGLGFAFTEDVAFLLAEAGRVGIDAAIPEFLDRRDFFGVTMLQHGIYTAIFGAGLGLATISKRRIARIGYPILGMGMAMGLHAMNNGLPQLVLVTRYGFAAVAEALADPFSMSQQMAGTMRAADAITVALNYLMMICFFAGVALWLGRQRQVIRAELPEEVEEGLIDQRDADLVPHYIQRLAWYWQLVRIGEIERARVVRRLHIELARLAFAKHWLPDPEDIAQCRQRIATLQAERAVDVYVGR